MDSFRLPDQTHIGNVHLRISDASRALDFYSGLLGLRIVNRRENSTLLASEHGKRTLIALTEDPDAIPKPPHTTGLYHMAIRIPNRLELARVFKRLIEMRYPLGGMSDHLVSEAIYLSDPEGNGIEIYRNRPREQWLYQNGMISMTTKRLDPNDLLAELENDDYRWNGIDPRTDMGHVHLQVSDLSRSEEFYHRRLGFEVSQRSYSGALFLAAGRYHHHLGLNVWESLGAPPPPQNSVGLISYSIVLPDEETWHTVKDRLLEAGLGAEEREGPSLLVRDPDSIGVEITV